MVAPWEQSSGVARFQCTSWNIWKMLCFSAFSGGERGFRMKGAGGGKTLICVWGGFRVDCRCLPFSIPSNSCQFPVSGYEISRNSALATLQSRDSVSSRVGPTTSQTEAPTRQQVICYGKCVFCCQRGKKGTEGFFTRPTILALGLHPYRISWSTSGRYLCWPGPVLSSLIDRHWCHVERCF